MKTARTKYSEFVKYGSTEGHRQEFHSGTSGGSILGDDTFVESVYEKSEEGDKKAVTVDEIIERVGKVYGLTEEEMVTGGKQRRPSEARGMIAYLVCEVKGMSLTALGKRMKRDASSLGLAADKIMRGSKEDSEIRKKKKILEKKLS